MLTAPTPPHMSSYIELVEKVILVGKVILSEGAR
jgi:hypothetical protein